MSKSLSQLEAIQAVASALQRHIADLEQQHKEQEAAILKIAKRMEKTIYPTILGSFAAELRAIFAPKKGK